MGSHSNLDNNNAFTPSVKNDNVEYFLLGPSQKSDRRASTEITKQLQRDFEDIFNGIGCFDGMFTLQLKPDSKSYQAPPGR